MTGPIHAALKARGLTPDEHFVDSGYPSAALVVESARDFGIELVSPLLADTSHQARAAGGYARADFTIDFDAKTATCPQGRTSTWWTPALQRGTEVVVIKFAGDTCAPCPARADCTRSARGKWGRQLTVPPREVHQARQGARAAANTPGLAAALHRPRRRRGHHTPGHRGISAEMCAGDSSIRPMGRGRACRWSGLLRARVATRVPLPGGGPGRCRPGRRLGR